MDTAIFNSETRKSSRGRTKEIYNDLRQDVIRMFPGSMIPSIKQLQNSYSAGQSTIVKAISALEDEGLLIRKPRKGIFVAGKIEKAGKEAPGYTYPSWISVPRDHVKFAVPRTSDIALWNNLASVFNSNRPHVSVVMEQISDREIFSPAVYNDEMPDMTVFSHPVTSDYHYFNPLDWLDLSPFLQTLKRDDYYRNAFISDGEERVWGASPYITTSLVAINQDILLQCGEKLPEDSWTWEDLLALSVRLKREMSTKGMKWAFVLMGYMNYFFHKGVSFRNEETGQYILNTPAMKEAFILLKRMIVDEKAVPMWSEVRGKYSSPDIIKNGVSAMAEEYSYYTKYENAGFEIGMASTPLSPGGVRTASISPICISSASLNIDDCWEFLKFMLSEQGQKIVVKHTNSLPAMKSVIPAGLSMDRLRVQQLAVAHGEILYSRCEEIFPVRNIIESAVEKWLRFGGNLDTLLSETETVCRWQIEKQRHRENGR